ncbi:MAG: SRPBCC family protein [Sinobacteraceae bacterium]|nr:SRPBCC family protein [Nevskiaceae bacterium]
MEIEMVSTGTVKFHRVLKAPAERVFKAFIDADALAKWLPPFGFTGKVHEMEPRVGGKYRMSFTNFSTGSSLSFGGEYLEIVENKRLCHTDQFDDPNLPGVMRTTVTFKQLSVGTELNVVQDGIPAAIPVEACYLGWQESLALLTQLVEVHVPDEGGT